MYYRDVPDVDWIALVISAVILTGVIIYSPGPTTIATGFEKLRILDIATRDNSAFLVLYSQNPVRVVATGDVNGELFFSAGVNEIPISEKKDTVSICFVLENNISDCGSIRVMYK